MKEAWHNAGNDTLGGWGTLQTTSPLCDLFQFIYSDQLCSRFLHFNICLCDKKKQKKQNPHVFSYYITL